MNTHRATAPWTAVMLSLGMLAASCTPESEPTTTTDPVPTTRASVLPPNATEQVKTAGLVALSDEELLARGDLSDTASWWTASDAHFLVDSAGMHLCRGFGMFTTSPPLSELEDRTAATYESDSAHWVHEIVYSDAEDRIDAAYASLVRDLRNCVDSPDRWRDDGDPDTVEVRDSLSDGSTQTGRLSTLPVVGDDRFAMQYEWWKPDGSRRYCLHRLAIIRLGNRLAIVELVKGCASGCDEYPDSDFVLLVENAIERLAA